MRQTSRQADTPTNSGAEYLRMEEVLARYKVSRGAWWKWRRAGLVPSAVEIVPGVLRWRLADLLAWEHQRERGAAA